MTRVQVKYRSRENVIILCSPLFIVSRRNIEHSVLHCIVFNITFSGYKFTLYCNLNCISTVLKVSRYIKKF